VREHTATPWKLLMTMWKDESNEKVYAVYSEQGHIIADCGVEWGTIADDKDLINANAAYIVKAVNNHEALLEACKEALLQLEDRYDYSKHPSEGCEESPFNGAGNLIHQLKQAITKAEG